MFWSLICPNVYFLIFVISETKSCHVPLSIECEGKSLDIRHQFCCNSQTYEMYNVTTHEKQCCCIDSKGGTEIVHTQDQICCAGDLHDAYDDLGRERYCCGATVYADDRNSLCCNPGALIPHASPRLYKQSETDYWDTAECCGNQIINRHTQKCCPVDNLDFYQNVSIKTVIGDTFDWFCCALESYNHKTHWCMTDDKLVKHVLRHFHQPCGDIDNLYDTRHNMCCDGVLHPKPLDGAVQYVCCGRQVRNSVTQNCCEDTFTIDKSKMCCGKHTEGFDRSVELCCEYPKSIYNKYGITKEHEGCCGHGLYDTNTEFCCRGQPFANTLYKRCGVTMSNCTAVPHTAMCCGHEQLHTNSTCCGNSFTVPKTSSTQDECCYNRATKSDAKPYSTSTQQCLGGQVVRKAKRCHEHEYNDTTDLCCFSNLFRGAIAEGKQCCNYDVFDNRTQECCHGYVINGTSCPRPRQLATTEDPICDDLCSLNRRGVRARISQGQLDVCRRFAYVAEVKWQKVGFEREINKYAIRAPSLNFYGRREAIWHRHIFLPCSCKRNFQRIIVITSKKRYRKKILLSRLDGDIVLPYSKRIKRAVLTRWKTACPYYTIYQHRENNRAQYPPLQSYYR